MPVLRQHDVVVAADQAIDHRHDGVGARDSQGATLAKIVLHIDNNQHLVRHPDILPQSDVISPWSSSLWNAAIQ
jgi:hypothetical protein